MLKVFRDNLKSLSWVLWAVIAVFVLLVFVDFGTSVPGRMSSGAAAATVGDREVTFADFRQQYRQLESQYRQLYGEQFTPELAKQLRLPIQALDQLVAQQILLGEAESLGLTTTDEELRKAILAIDVFRNEQGAFIGREAYEALLRANGFTTADFEADLREQIVLQKLNTLLSSSVYVSQEEVESTYRERNEKASIRFLQLAPRDLNAEIELSQDELARYYEEHAEAYRLPEQRVAAFLQIDANRVRSRIEISDEDVRAYYDAHGEEFTREEQVRARHILLRVDRQRSDEQARVQMEEIRSRLAAGEDFAALARELSDDPGSKERGGDLGFFGRGRMIKEFEEAAFAATPGEVIGPIKTSFGLHLIEVLDHREGGVQPLDEVAGRIRSRLLADRSQEEAKRLAEALHARIQSEGLTEESQLEALAEEDESYLFRVTPPFGADDNVPGVGRAGNFSLTAFELGIGEISDPVALPRGYALLRLREILEPRLPELAEVENEVRRDALEAARIARAEERLQELRKALEAGTTTLDDAAAELGLEVQESGELTRDQPIAGLASSAAVAKAALELDQGDYGGPLSDPQGPVIFEVVSRTRFDPAAFAAEADGVRESLTRSRVSQLLASVIDQRRLDLDVHYDRGLVESMDLETAPEAG